MAIRPEDLVEIIPDRLYWVSLSAAPKSTEKSHFFSIDNRFVYEAFTYDFGPVDLAMTFRYCCVLGAKLNDPELAGKKIVHCCRDDPHKRANAAYLMCAYSVLVLRRSPERAFEPFTHVQPPFLPFRDATRAACTFHLTILDCLRGLETAVKLGWFDISSFDVNKYEYFQHVNNGDANWIIPKKFLAFAGPSSTPVDSEGMACMVPEDYVPFFRAESVSLVIRLNSRQYDENRFLAHGLKHMDLYFKDGSCPSSAIIGRFFSVVEQERGAIAIHCKAGLGRTGTLIGLYAMKHHGFPARPFIAWIRICRPGSILGPQQQFLCNMQDEMFCAGAAARRPTSGLPCEQEQALARRMESLRFQEAVDHADSGQGEHLCSSKRNAMLKSAAT
eukprot:TRINITY_DN30963_c0_g1_i1.p1 TRINITY_DN30963_c0_g1~~TRINITY_DN30963_c0_g1_i1.p1  ORF type:complete len:388 (-),score=67.51 TRINITY_DN30963_c0_g1_i1:219-1382(-)